MKIGLSVPSINPLATAGFLGRFAPRAEANGFSSLWVGEHVVLFDDYASPYPYSRDGRLFLPGDVGMLEPFQTLTFLAAITQQIRLGTGVCLVPQRNPVYTAKAAATLDWLSDGRLDFGIGLGWSREEFAALGVPWSRRAARCREYVEVMRRLWTDEHSAFTGEFYELPTCRQYPKPVQQPHPPLIFGGESEAALRRVAHQGDGWFGYNLVPDDAADLVRRLAVLLDEQGRRIDDVEVTIGTYFLPVDRAALEQYHDAGVDQVVVLELASTVDDALRALDRLADELVAPAADW
jgi:probable F420-dependent oxidoreductase